MTETKPIPKCYWVVPGKLLAGEYPRSAAEESSEIKIRALLEAGVTCFIDLSHPDDGLKPYAQLIERFADAEVAVKHFPISDLSVPQSGTQTADILDAIDSEIQRGGMVYLHCWGGVGRTGVMVGCWLVRNGHTGQEALARLKELWRACPKSAMRQSPETAEQRRYIVDWSEPPDGTRRRQTTAGCQWYCDDQPMRSRFRGCILGLAIGDALGAPVEFLSSEQIIERYGPAGVAELEAWGGLPPGHYTDDTQMSLATAVAMIRARQRWRQNRTYDLPGVVYRRYLAWRETQRDPHESRAPGHTCLSALDSGRMGAIEAPINSSKGCGGVMRTAPVGLALQIEDPFYVGAQCAAITHGHPSGYLTAGYLSELIRRLVQGCELKSAARATRYSLMRYERHQETLQSVDRALELARSTTAVHDAIGELGQGWVGEEALAISLFCASRYPTGWAAATLAAVNHSGDSDSTGSICGAILGAALGVESIPARWIEQLENGDLLRKTADDLYATHVGETTLSLEEYPAE